jgi:hypothetical protein
MAEQAGSTLTRHDLEAKIVKRCWEDEAFRKEFTSDPASAFVKYLDVPKGSLPKIVVHEETPGSWHIVLLPPPENIGELSEQDLEAVAGGCSKIAVSSIIYDLGADSAIGATLSLAASGVSAVIASGVASLIAGQNIDTGW